MAIFLLIAALFCPNIARDEHVKIARARRSVRVYMKAHPCPGGRDRGSKRRCDGYVVDHVIPLCLGGKDDPSNMQWQTERQGHEKDQAEVALCRWYYKACGWEW